MSYLKPLIILSGPTAVGKTDLSISLAQKFGCEIISADSMQIYKGMDIGTAKVTQEEMNGVPHHLIDILKPNQQYDAAQFVADAMRCIKDIHRRGKQCLITGGTGLYLSTLLEGLDTKIPVYPHIRQELERELNQSGPHKLHNELFLCDRISASRIHVRDSHRLLRALEIFRGSGIPWSSYIADHTMEKQQQNRFPASLHISLQRPREQLYQRIDKRVHLMLAHGFEEEVRALQAAGYDRRYSSMNSIGYKHMVEYLTGEITKEEMVRTMARDTRRYAKRQNTWFKKMLRVRFISCDQSEKVFTLVEKQLSNQDHGAD